jgi:2-keto-4-pentenoate hydratase/2-oxohepta-3-ene-1,7-dioic acid hydratase in catechol pathway
MRLTAVWYGTTSVMGVVRDARFHPLTTVEKFYEDPARCLEETRFLTGAGVPVANVNLAPPVPVTARVLCAGVNYKSHAAEASVEPSTVPNLFARWASTLVPDGTDIPVPFGEEGLDWEVELALVIGAPIANADPDDACRAVLGYACFNDVSARTFQRASRQWALGKNADCSGPIGPVIVTPDELRDPYDLSLTTTVNGVVMQSASTSEMIMRGDEIPQLMGPGDVVEVEIDGIGRLRNRIVTRGEQ